jgi:hypothetical protein
MMTGLDHAPIGLAAAFATSLHLTLQCIAIGVLRESAANQQREMCQ